MPHPYNNQQAKMPPRPQKRKVFLPYDLVVHVQFREDKRCFLRMTIV